MFVFMINMVLISQTVNMEQHIVNKKKIPDDSFQELVSYINYKFCNSLNMPYSTNDCEESENENIS